LSTWRGDLHTQLKGCADLKRLSAAHVAAARVRLGYLADSLYGHDFLGPAQTIRDFLAGKFSSLDEAFGLVAPARRPRALADPDRGLLIAREIDPLKRQRMTWDAIEEALDKPGCLARGLTVRQLRRIYDAYSDIDSGGVPEWRRTSVEIEAISNEVVRRLQKTSAATRPPRPKDSRPQRIAKPRRSKSAARKSAGKKIGLE
jgi:hypothetical protein